LKSYSDTLQKPYVYAITGHSSPDDVLPPFQTKTRTKAADANLAAKPFREQNARINLILPEPYFFRTKRLKTIGIAWLRLKAIRYLNKGAAGGVRGGVVEETERIFHNVKERSLNGAFTTSIRNHHLLSVFLNKLGQALFQQSIDAHNQVFSAPC